MADQSAYLGRVQVLRFVAATAVLFAHLQHEVQARLLPQAPFRPFALIDGGVGVDLFFVISGFIMYHVAADKFGQPGAVRSFLVRRFTRIAPLYYIATALMLLATFAFDDAVAIAQPDPWHVLASFLFLPATNPAGEIVPVLKLGWTLNFEAFFYAAFAFALAFPRRAGLAVLGAILLATVTAAAVLPDPPVALAFWGQSLVFEFLGGIAIAMLFHRQVHMRAGQAATLIALGVLMLIALRQSGLNAMLPRAIYDGLPAWMIVAGVVLGRFQAAGGPIQRLFEAGGEASYAIYVMHPFGIRAGTLLWRATGAPDAPWLFIAAIGAVVIASAFAVNALVERPLDRRLRSLVHRPRAPVGRPAMPPA